MDIADELFQIGIFLACNGFIAVLESLSVTLVAAIETNGVSCKEFSHDS